MLRASVVVMLAVSACAHAPAAPASSEPSVPPEPPARGAFVDSALGYSLSLPAELGFSAPERGSITAVNADGVVVRVLPVFLSTEATIERCWARVGPRVFELDAAGLVRTAERGFDREGGRRTFPSVHVRGEACLLLVVDGPGRDEGERSRLERCAQVARATFRVLEPDPGARGLLALEAGFQLLDAKEDAVAMERFERALQLDPSLQQAHFGAGIAAFQAGKGFEAKAIEHLEAALAQRSSEQEEEVEAPAAGLIRDALVDLGLAYLQARNLAASKARMLEASVRYPEDAVVLYNLACLHAIAGEADEAIYQLRSAFARDEALREHARTDEDLASLRDRSDFRALVATAQRGR